ncbi:MAG: TIGR03751 family conjugal transfer lipoprotein [Gammaproteobacteria bacterium]|nr:TIGR03751 family conjugal transfer lipoprotein [Gammaproteobacteria bacterium]
MTNLRLPAIALVLISAGLTACATTGAKNSILPTGLKPMSEIYKEHFEHGKAGPDQNRPSLPKRPSSDGDADLHGTLRIAGAGLDHTFARLANPTLVMYVYPHLAGPSGAPVPGYATRFTLYDRVEYAVPGEFMEAELTQGPSR